MSNAGRRGMCRRRPQERRIRGLGGSCLGASGRLLARRSRPLRTGAVSIRVGAAHAYSPGHGRGASGVGETVVRRCDADRLLHAWPGTLERDVAKAAVARKATLNRCFLLPFSAIASAASRRSPRREISVDRAAAGRRAPGRRSPSYSATRLTGGLGVPSRVSRFGPEPLGEGGSCYFEYLLFSKYCHKAESSVYHAYLLHSEPRR
jgi:hypothetical protein